MASIRGTGKYLEIARTYWNKQRSTWGADNFMDYGKRCEVVYAEPERLKFEFPVTGDVLNTVNTLHGGATATLLDICMSMAHFVKQDADDNCPTVDINVQFLNSCKPGDTLVIDVHTVKAGKSLGFFRGDVYRKSDGAIVATGTQTLSLKSKM